MKLTAEPGHVNRAALRHEASRRRTSRTSRAEPRRAARPASAPGARESAGVALTMRSNAAKSGRHEFVVRVVVMDAVHEPDPLQINGKRDPPRRGRPDSADDFLEHASNGELYRYFWS